MTVGLGGDGDFVLFLTAARSKVDARDLFIVLSGLYHIAVLQRTAGFLHLDCKGLVTACHSAGDRLFNRQRLVGLVGVGDGDIYITRGQVRRNVGCLRIITVLNASEVIRFAVICGDVFEFVRFGLDDGVGGHRQTVDNFFIITGDRHRSLAVCEGHAIIGAIHCVGALDFEGILGVGGRASRQTVNILVNGQLDRRDLHDRLVVLCRQLILPGGMFVSYGRLAFGVRPEAFLPRMCTGVCHTFHSVGILAMFRVVILCGLVRLNDCGNGVGIAIFQRVIIVEFKAELLLCGGLIITNGQAASGFFRICNIIAVGIRNLNGKLRLIVGTQHKVHILRQGIRYGNIVVAGGDGTNNIVESVTQALRITGREPVLIRRVYIVDQLFHVFNGTWLILVIRVVIKIRISAYSIEIVNVHFGGFCCRFVCIAFFNFGPGAILTGGTMVRIIQRATRTAIREENHTSFGVFRRFRYTAQISVALADACLPVRALVSPLQSFDCTVHSLNLIGPRQYGFCSTVVPKLDNIVINLTDAVFIL